jgi:translation initiation factor IF-2
MSVTHRVTGEADILQIFTINIKKRVTKSIAGCRIRNGSIKKTARARVLRKGQVVYDGMHSSPVSQAIMLTPAMQARSTP